MKPIRIAALAIALAGFAAVARAEEAPAPAVPVKAEPKQEIWTDNFEAAKAQAVKENKDILIDFTGSDWCGWCIQLKKEVFSTPEFEAAAPKSFVLMEADFPSKKKLAADVKEQNDKLQKQFGVRGFPTLYLLDSKGIPYASTGYRPGGPTPYLQELAKLQDVRVKRDAAWKKAVAAEGVEKAKLLAEGLSVMDEELATANYASVIEEIQKLDPQDSTGMVKKYASKAQMAALEKNVAQAASANKGDDAPALKVINDFIAANKPEGETLQKILMLKINLYPPRTAANIEKAVKVTEEVIAVDANTETGRLAQRIKQSADMFKQRMAAKAAAEKAKTAPTAPEAK